MDACAAFLWHDLKGPFPLPLNLLGHECQWELFDDYMAGCVLCGKVHRCDFDICEEVFPEDMEAFESYQTGRQQSFRCPTFQTDDDGSVICSITGSCVRSSAFGIEFEMIANKGLHAEDMTKLMDPHIQTQFLKTMMSTDTSYSASSSTRSGSRRDKQGSSSSHHSQSLFYHTTMDNENQQHFSSATAHGNNRKRSAERALSSAGSFSHSVKASQKKQKQGQSRQAGQTPTTYYSHWDSQTSQRVLKQCTSAFAISMDVMQGEFSIENIQKKVLQFLQMAGQNTNVLHARFLEASEKREACMYKMMAAHVKLHGMDGNNSRAVCLCTLAAAIAHSCPVEPFDSLQACSNEKLNEVAQRISSPIVRLLSVLKTLEASKYKGNALSSMVLGMIYLCTTGVNCGTVRILPCVPGLGKILPNDNRIHFYFGKMGVNTKCVTDMSNLINTALKDRPDILRIFD